MLVERPLLRTALATVQKIVPEGDLQLWANLQLGFWDYMRKERSPWRYDQPTVLKLTDNQRDDGESMLVKRTSSQASISTNATGDKQFRHFADEQEQ